MSSPGGTFVLLASIFESYALVAVCPSQLQWPAWSWIGALSTTIVANFLLLQFFKIFIYANFLTPLKHIPGPKLGLPIIGRARVMFERPPAQSFMKWRKYYNHDGLIRFQGLWNMDFLLITKTEILSEILVHKPYQFEKPELSRDQLRMILGDGLVVVEGDMHKFQRKRLMPTFSFRHIKDLYPMMWSKARGLCNRIDQEFQGPDEVVLDMVDWAAKATLDAIGLAALGRDINSVMNDADELAHLYRELTVPSRSRIIYFLISLIVGTRTMHKVPFPIVRKTTKQLNRLHEICRNFVHEKREAIAKHGEDKHDILSVLLNYNEFSDDELVDQMLTFLAAGFDTTSLTFTWTCYVLATRPGIQKKLRDEITAHMDELNAADARADGSLATMLEGMPYLNGVFHEVLRLYPTVPMTRRVSNQDTTVGGHAIPKGTHFVLSSWMINRSLEHWGADALEFKPERWIDKDTNKPNNHGGATSNFSLLTFLAGPRSCIGGNFAKAELRCLLANWVANFSMEDANTKPAVPVGAVTLKPLHGMFLRVKQVPRKERQ